MLTGSCGSARFADWKYRCQRSFFTSSKKKRSEETYRLRPPSSLEADEAGGADGEVVGAQSPIRVCGITFGLDLFFRDETLGELRWESGGLQLQMQQTAEKHVWRISSVNDLASDLGYIAVYVDDLLFAVDREHVEGLLGALQSVGSVHHRNWSHQIGT